MNLSVFPQVQVHTPGAAPPRQGWLMDLLVDKTGAVKAVVAMQDKTGQFEVHVMSRVHYWPEPAPNPQVGGATMVPLSMSGGQ